MPFLFKEILLTRGIYRLVILTITFMAAVFGILAPFFQKEFIDSLSQQKLFFDLKIDIWIYILLAFFAMLLAQACAQWANYLGSKEALIMQRILSEKIYAKILRLRVDTLSQRSVGETAALYATDVAGATVFLEQTLPMGAATLFPLIIAPFAISWIFSIPVWPTILIMIFVSLINTSLAFRQSKFFYKFKQLAGERIGLVNEWVQNIRALRILGWTAFFEKKIFHTRKIETENRVSMVTNGQMMNAISSSVTFFLNILTLYFLTVWVDKKLSAGEILALLWIAGIFLTRPFRQMPWFFTFAFDSWTSLKRLEQFLKATGELKSEVSTANFNKHVLVSPLNVQQPKVLAISIKNLNLCIGENHLLKNLTFDIQQGDLVAIVGEVGSGKSLLLLSLLKETGVTFEKYNIFNQDADTFSLDELRQYYSLVPQEGFIMSASLRENVGFLYDMDQSFDDEILKSLRLAQINLENERFTDGLDTSIGERGVNLSGGQKQRTSLARMHFLNAPILLLDDVLSALDADTEEKLFRDLISGAWKEKTRLLVTHRLSALNHVDKIIFLEEGRIIAQGTLQSLLTTCEKFKTYTKSLAENSKELHGK